MTAIITANDRAHLIRRFPVLTTTAEHECSGDLCPCFSVLEILEDEWRLDDETHGQCGMRFHEFVAERLREIFPVTDECECGNPDCRADHNAETKHEALWHDRI